MTTLHPFLVYLLKTYFGAIFFVIGTIKKKNAPEKGLLAKIFGLNNPDSDAPRIVRWGSRYLAYAYVALLAFLFASSREQYTGIDAKQIESSGSQFFNNLPGHEFASFTGISMLAIAAFLAFTNRLSITAATRNAVLAVMLALIFYWLGVAEANYLAVFSGA